MYPDLFRIELFIIRSDQSGLNSMWKIADQNTLFADSPTSLFSSPDLFEFLFIIL
jgi:hypothetical protein